MKAEVDGGLRAVFAAEHERLWRSLLAYAGDPEVASEAAAEAFAQAVRRGAALRDPAAWVWRSAFRIAAGLVRLHRARARLRAALEPEGSEP